MPELRALLDSPDPKSLGLVPIVLSDARGHLSASGYTDSSRHRGLHLDSASLDDLVRAKSALRVDQELPGEAGQNPVALWIGDDFTNLLDQVGMSLPPLPAYLIHVHGGRLSVGPPDELFVYLDQWVGAAFDRFRSVDDPALRKKLANLMHWALPSDHRTLAASWQSAPNASDELEMQLKVFASRTRPREWRKQLESVLAAPKRPFSNLEVVLFTGPTGSMRDTVFQEFVAHARRYRQALESTSFRQVIVDKARSVQPQGELGKELLMRVGQKVVDNSPLFVALSVEDLAKRAERMTLVVDSVRHKSVLNAVKWLVNARVTSIGVMAAPRDIHQRLAEEHYIDRQIQNDPTEREIPELVGQAQYRIDTTEGSDWQRDVAKISSEVFA